MKTFLRRTFFGGLFFVVPVTVVIIVLSRLHAWIGAAVAPLAAEFPYSATLPALWATAALVLLCFAAGLLLQIKPVRAIVTRLQDRFADVFPTFQYLQRFEAGLGREGGSTPIHAALAEIEEALVPAFVVDELSDGSFVVFVPAVPSVYQGAVYILTPERVHLLDANVRRVAQCVRHWGIGSAELVAAMRKSDAPA